MRPILFGFALLLASTAAGEAHAQARSGTVTYGQSWNRGQDLDRFDATTRARRAEIQRRAMRGRSASGRATRPR